MRLIINADDFGLSKSITDGIIDGIKEGVITSTSVMINMEYSEYAIKKAIENEIYAVGLHINLTAGKPIIKNKNLTDEAGRFLNRNIQLANKIITYEDIYNEIIAQINKFNEYSEGKLKIDHIDAHHFLINNDIVKKVVEDISSKFNIPVRNENGIKAKCPDIIYVDFSLDDVSIESINKMISLYKDKDIIVELLTHPGYLDEYTKFITSKLDREEELRILKEAKDRGVFEHIQLINFSQF